MSRSKKTQSPSSRRHLSRRTFLRGAVGGTAVALALPTLDAMLTPNGAHADGSDRGPFFGVFFWANGLPWHSVHGGEQAGNPDVWTPASTGAGFAATPLLAPLMRHQVSVATGLQPHTDTPATPGGQGDGHMRGFMNSLTGDRIRSEGFDHPSHTLTALRPSIDQYVAQHPSFYSEEPRFRSIVAGASTARFHDYGHWNAISYNGPDALNQPYLDPNTLHTALFDVPASAVEAGRRGRLLDAVLGDARDLRAKVGASDKLRIDAHLEHLYTIQGRLGQGGALCEEPGRPGNLVGLGRGSALAKTEIMGELLALAVRCDITRSFSFMLTSPASTHVYDQLGVPDGLHKTVHDGHWSRMRDVTLHQMECFAAFLDNFNTDDGMGGTLLDRGVVYGCSEYGEGYKHSVKEMPVVFAGGGCGRLARGVHTRNAGGNIVDAHMTTLQALGLPDTEFGWNGGRTTDSISGFVL
jgi:hypothetical protein